MIPAIPAHAAIIDFQSLEVVGTEYDYVPDVYSYTEKGFTFDALNSVGFARWFTLNPNYPGSTALINKSVDGITRLTQVGGGAFDLASIDLTSYTTSWNFTGVFTGTKADLSTVTQSFTTDHLVSLETFTFNSGFTNLTKVEWGGPGGQFDNINVTATSAVPEPLTILGAMTATGFGAIFKRKLAQKKTDKKD